MIKMKGITPVIAIILLILITISVVGFFFAFFTTFMSDISNQTGEQAIGQQRIMGTDVELIDVSEKDDKVSVMVRNSGTVSIKENTLSIIAKDPSGDIIETDSNPSVIEKNSVITINTGINCSGGQDITVTVEIYGKKYSKLLACSGAVTITTTTTSPITTTTSTTSPTTTTTTTTTTTSTTISYQWVFTGDCEARYQSSTSKINCDAEHVGDYGYKYGYYGTMACRPDLAESTFPADFDMGDSKYYTGDAGHWQYQYICVSSA